MEPLEHYRNGHGELSGGDSSDSECDGPGCGAPLELRDAAAPGRALAALNALRKSRQHYDVVLLADGEEIAAHSAILAAASPYLLEALPPMGASGGEAGAGAGGGGGGCGAAGAAHVVAGGAAEVRALVEFAYTGRLRAAGPAAARALYLAAWGLRIEAARALLAQALVERAARGDWLALRALPDLEPALLERVDLAIDQNFDALWASGALAALPVLRVELHDAGGHGAGRAEAAAGAGRGAGAGAGELDAAGAALGWLQRCVAAGADVRALSGRGHLLYADARHELRDCGLLPAARGEPPRLAAYRREQREREHHEAEVSRRPEEPRRGPAVGRSLGARSPGASPLGARPLGARAPRPRDWAVLAARPARALLWLQDHAAIVSFITRPPTNGAVDSDPNSGDEAAEEGGAEPTSAGGARGAGGAAVGRSALMADARCALGAAALGGRLLVCGGYDRARVLREVEELQVGGGAGGGAGGGGGGWRAAPGMPSRRARFPAALLGGRVYAVGGSDGQRDLASVVAFDGARWAACRALGGARSHAAAAACERRGRLFVVGGWAGGHCLRRVDVYRPAADQWTEGPPLDTGRSQSACVVWEGALWALGGCDNWHCLASVEYLPLGEPGEVGEVGEAWAAGPALPTARRSAGGAAWRGALLVAGGSDGSASLSRTDWMAPGPGPESRAWRAGPALRRARAGAALVALGGAGGEGGDGPLVAVGGFDGKNFLSDAETLSDLAAEWTTLRETRPPPPSPGDGDVIKEKHEDVAENKEAVE